MDIRRCSSKRSCVQVSDDDTALTADTIEVVVTNVTIPALTADVIELVVRSMTIGSMLTSLHINKEWAVAALKMVGKKLVSKLVSRAIDGKRCSVRRINDLSVRGRQLGADKLEAMFYQTASLFRSVKRPPPLKNIFHINEDETAKERAWRTVKWVLKDCPIARTSIARRVLKSKEFRNSIDVWLLHEIVRASSGGAYVDRMAQIVMRKIVSRQEWWIAMALLKADGGDAWKRALFKAMRYNHGLEVNQAVAFCEAFSGRNCFITGAGGCGKSHVVNLLRDAISSAHASQGLHETIALLAPTKVAAARIGGQTYHSWGGFRPKKINLKDIISPHIHTLPGMSSEQMTDEEQEQDETIDETMELGPNEVFVPFERGYVKERVARVKTIFLDEVSMISPFHFGCLEVVVSKYGGRNVQWILAGDFCQLPSILKKNTIEYEAHSLTKTRFLFETLTWKNSNMFSIELDVNRRSATHMAFCTILAHARLGLTTDEKMDVVRRLKEITAASSEKKMAQFGIYPTKKAPHWLPSRPNCEQANKDHLESLSSPVIPIPSINNSTAWGAECASLPSVIKVQIGQSLRVTRGDDRGVIGTLREVLPNCLMLETETGDMVYIDRITATSIITKDKRTDVATRSQFMVRTSFGLTVHGVQGKSMRHFMVGCDGFWEHGQAYVALSRATDPALMYLEDLDNLKFICDPRVKNFYAALANAKPPTYANKA